MKNNIENKICDKNKVCDWLSSIHDEMGVIDYCIRRDIYGDVLEGMTECYYFQSVERREE